MLLKCRVMKVLGKRMDAKTYRVQTIREALDLIREELGPNASLLHCRRIRRPGVRGWITGGTDPCFDGDVDHRRGGFFQHRCQ